MSGVNQGPLGVLREGWSTTVADYAIAGGWSRGGELLVVADAAGGVHGLDRTSGATAWSQSGCHGDGLLALAFHPDGSRFATAGQDGRVLLWTVSGEVTHRVDVGSGWVESSLWERSPLSRQRPHSICRLMREWGSVGGLGEGSLSV